MTDYIAVQVPEAHYREMLTHLVSLLSARPVESAMPAAETAAAPAPGLDDRAWPEDVWRSVWPVLRDDTQRLLVLLAEHPIEWVPFSAWEDELGSRQAVQSALSSFTKRIKKLGLHSWPFRYVIDDQSRRFRYQMDKATAAIVLELSRAGS